MKFKVNDYVQVSNPNRKRIHGAITSIVEVDHSDDKKPYMANIEGNVYWFEESELQLYGYRAVDFGSEINKYPNIQPSHEAIHKPKHYIGINGLEVETINRNFLPKIKDGYVSHRIGSALEYILRHPDKNGLEDIKKAHQNLEQIIQYWESGDRNG